MTTEARGPAPTERCLRCGQSETENPAHERTFNGWHDFTPLAYMLALEDALLFARDEKRHDWYKPAPGEAILVIDTYPSFVERYCERCGDRNWGGRDDGICFGSREGWLGVIQAHNRRAVASWSERDD